jgi:hypothetical protein
MTKQKTNTNSVPASVLTPELREFIDRAIVPALVKQYMEEIELAQSDSDTASSLRHTASIQLRTARS